MNIYICYSYKICASFLSRWQNCRRFPWLYFVPDGCLCIVLKYLLHFNLFCICLCIVLCIVLNCTFVLYSNILLHFKYLFTFQPFLCLPLPRLTDMGPAWHYPTGLKQLDLSHNNIATWPNLAQYSAEASENESCQICYALGTKPKTSSGQGNRTPRNSRSGLGPPHMCPHRRHVRLEGLKTLVLADNQLTRLCLYLEEGQTIALQETPDESMGSVSKGRLVFPSLSMLDVSNNCLKELPSSLHNLTGLAVLNISGNADIQELPPEMGLLSRMWNLNTRGCSLQDPLKTMIESKKYKTMDVIGYLKVSASISTLVGAPIVILCNLLPK